MVNYLQLLFTAVDRFNKIYSSIALQIAFVIIGIMVLYLISSPANSNYGGRMLTASCFALFSFLAVLKIYPHEYLVHVVAMLLHLLHIGSIVWWLLFRPKPNLSLEQAQVPRAIAYFFIILTLLIDVIAYVVVGLSHGIAHNLQDYMGFSSHTWGYGFIVFVKRQWYKWLLGAQIMLLLVGSNHLAEFIYRLSKKLSKQFQNWKQSKGL